MDITKEQLEYVRKRISQGERISLDEKDAFSAIDLKITLARNTNSYYFSTIHEDIADASKLEYIRHFKLKLSLYDHELNEDIAKIAFMNLSLIPTREFMEDEDEYLDSDTDTHYIFSYLLELDDAQMNDELFDTMSTIYPYAMVYYAEMHNFYVSPEFRGLGIAGFLYSRLNDIFWSEYNQVIHLLGVHVNPFIDQGTLLDWDMEEVYCNTEQGNEELFQTLRRGLIKNGFIAMDEEDRYYYKNMLADLDVPWDEDDDCFDILDIDDEE